jgi:hypothetical protein
MVLFEKSNKCEFRENRRFYSHVLRKGEIKMFILSTLLKDLYKLLCKTCLMSVSSSSVARIYVPPAAVSAKTQRTFCPLMNQHQVDTFPFVCFINSQCLYMFRALLAHPQEVLRKWYLV